MNNKTLIKLMIVIVALIGLTIIIYYRKTIKKRKELFKTAKFEKRNITYIINATGALEAQGTIKVGSLINGVVKDLYAKENDTVRKGQLLVQLDNGKGDTDVRRTAGFLEQAKAKLNYQKAFFKRQEKLYNNGHISLDAFEKAKSSYKEAEANVKTQEATNEQAIIDYNNTMIKSPIDGIVVKKNVSLGEGVSSFLMPTVLYEIAEDLRIMDAILEVDETYIGDLKVGQKSKLNFDTYPNKVFIGKIKEIGTGAKINKGTVSYEAKILLDNKDLLLKPGMTIHANIIVAKKKNVLAIPGYIFSINPKLIELVAKEKKYSYKALTKDELNEFKKTLQCQEHAVRTVWVLHNTTFMEKAIEIGLTDKTFFEIVKGLHGDEDVVIDVEETDAMKEMFKRLFGGGMSR